MTRTARIGIIGFGLATSPVIGPLLEHGGFEVVGAADPDPLSRARFEKRFGRTACESPSELFAGAELDAVYIATPTRLHEELTLMAFEQGVDVLVEKPIAITVESAERMIAASKRFGRVLMVNHKRSVDREIVTLRSVIRSREIGSVRTLNRWHYSDWFYRPRAAEERDPALGGVVLRQGSHEFDILRSLFASPPVRVSAWVGDLDRARPGEGAYHAWIECEDGTVATSFYSGYDRFLSDELTVGVLPAQVIGSSQRKLADQAPSAQAEHDLKRTEGHPRPPELVTDMYGFTLVSCDGADLRTAPGGGAWVYDGNGRHKATVSGNAGTRFIVDELHRAVTDRQPPLHDGEWGLACLELCEAVRRAAATGGAVALKHQTPVSEAVADVAYGHRELSMSASD